MLANKRTYLKKYKGQYTDIYLNIFMIKAKINMITKRTFDKWLIYSSNLPSFVAGSLEFILALV